MGIPKNLEKIPPRRGGGIAAEYTPAIRLLVVNDQQASYHPVNKLKRTGKEGDIKNIIIACLTKMMLQDISQILPDL